MASQGMASRGRVVVAMSGGVDSSVAAALLKEQGYDVIGMMLRLWSEPGKEDSNRCCTPDSMAQARRAAARLGIPFYAIDAQEAFHKVVVNYFLEGYARGETPNPCLACNRQIRWGFLLQHALAFGADFLATGHYTRLCRDGQNSIQILRAVDRQKDQSYVLHVLTQEQLKHALFPIGEYTKPQVRELAHQYGLSVAERPDSQDLCFLAGDDYRNFLLRNSPEIATPGPILNRAGEILGEHSGLASYTIGQRKGLGVSSPQPMYVLKKNIQANTLIIGTADELGSQELLAKQVNWISGYPPAGPINAQVKTRYTASAVPGVVTPKQDGSAHVLFEQPLRDITPGQAAVFYNQDICLGGGII